MLGSSQKGMALLPRYRRLGGLGFMAVLKGFKGLGLGLRVNVGALIQDGPRNSIRTVESRKAQTLL